MSLIRKIAVVAGVFFIVAASGAIAGLVLYQPVLKHPGYILGPGADTLPSLLAADLRSLSYGADWGG